MNANWAKWNEEKPEWFTPARIQRIPDDMIPAQALAKLKQSGRRKSSVFQQLGLEEVALPKDDDYSASKEVTG